MHQLLERYCATLFDLYTPDQWVPHITLAMGDLSSEDLQLFKENNHHMKPVLTPKVDHLSLVEFKEDGSVALL
ncbi:hypothetical protein [Halobacillus sp. B23F22_1]|uniref:hypothetical protein n=1 Tax=Halobacillus sp. B23F22_1 TaxID=3459514 RepID=UPI00373E7AE6